MTYINESDVNLTLPNYLQAYTSFMEGSLARPGQTLQAHTEHVAALASRFAQESGISQIAYICGALHDLGKATDDFQSYLQAPNAVRGSVLHSIFGAAQSYKTFAAYPPAAEMLANVILAHHGSLYDNLSPCGETPLQDRMQNGSCLLEAETPDTSALQSEFEKALLSVPDIHRAFGCSMLTKLLYSCLVDADRLDAYMAEGGTPPCSQVPDWSALLAQLENTLSAYTAHSGMARLRGKVSEDCAKAGLKRLGIYKLEVPTGGGKTLSSLRFALRHAKTHGLDRIIYVIPYLSILSQTAIEIRRALALGEDSDILLEHYSNILDFPDEDAHYQYKLHTERWDAPIILTTQVQFLESIFSARGSHLRKLHNMARSVLIFDEVQSIPLKCIDLFNGAVSFIHNIMGSTLLLCTATQPLLDKVQRPVAFTQGESIAAAPPFPNRYTLADARKAGGYSYQELASFVIEKHNISTLVIVNTKAAAKNLTNALQDAGVKALHLSTNMCAAHRDAVIKILRGALDDREPVLCVSTQLIEAGVDISFECVIRSLAGLDSICQAAGRCNRHGEFGEAKQVYIVNIAEEILRKLPDIYEGANATQRLLDDGTLDMELYYKYYFYARKGIMNYPLPEGGSIYDLLSENQKGKHAYRERIDKNGVRPPKLTTAIRSAADAFCVIDRGRTEVVVPYNDESERLLAQFLAETDIARQRRLLKKLGRYSVSLYRYQVDELHRRHALTLVHGRGAQENGEKLLRLEHGFYHQDRGVDLDGSHEFLFV